MVAGLQLCYSPEKENAGFDFNILKMNIIFAPSLCICIIRKEICVHGIYYIEELRRCV